MMTQVNNNTAVFELAKAIKGFEDSHPEVGLGYSLGHFIDEAVKRLNITRDDINYDYILDQMKNTKYFY